MLDDLLELIFQEYYKTTDQPWEQPPRDTRGYTNVDHKKALPEAVGLVNKR